MTYNYLITLHFINKNDIKEWYVFNRLDFHT